MIRAFVALPLPETLRQQLHMLAQMLPLPRRVAPEAMHLTLVFLGELDEPLAEEAHRAFETIVAHPFPLTLRGVGAFGGGRPRSVHAEVAPEPALDRLQSKVAQAARLAGVALDHRRFTPHVTLGRLKPGEVDPRHLEQALVRCGGFAAGTIRVDRFCLYRSHLARAGAVYEELASYPLV